MSLGGISKKIKNDSTRISSKKKKKRSPGQKFGFNEENDDDSDVIVSSSINGQTDILHLEEKVDQVDNVNNAIPSSQSNNNNSPKKKRNRWDAAPQTVNNDDTNKNNDDALDSFMEKLEAGAMGSVAMQNNNSKEEGGILEVDVGGSMMKLSTATTTTNNNKPPLASPLTGGVITAEDLTRLNQSSSKQKDTTSAGDDEMFTHSDWESDTAHNNGAESSASEVDTDDEGEETARRNFIEALKNSVPLDNKNEDDDEEEDNKPQLASEVKSEKQRREDRMRQLEQEAGAARVASQTVPEIGRMYNDMEGGVMEEAERTLDVLTAAPDALEVLADLNKKKELKAVDHTTIDYTPIRKNLYIVPRSLANLSSDDVADRRAKLKIKIRGQRAPSPVSTFRECGLSERVLSILAKQKIASPFPVQAQCLPCIMAGRDVIGIAKTGSGKTLAYLLPMLRHIGDQSPLELHESGPIGLVMAPARELAVQIHAVCKVFCKNLGFNVMTYTISFLKIFNLGLKLFHVQYLKYCPLKILFTII
uniref:RNA helicase n=1 Tax=Eucampia antarctica TaxID=49252 RepID=A0A7S2SL86_9STRA